MRLVVSILFVVIIVLAAAITKFYSDTSKSTSPQSAETDIDKMHGADRYGNRIFENSSGLYGIADANDRIIVAPEWSELTFADNDMCIAASSINGTVLKGCINYDGNIVVPLIYKSITRHAFGSFTFYTAEADADGSWVIYDRNFSPCFSRSWESCNISDDTITLSGGNGIYIYCADGEKLSLINAEISGSVMNCPYTMTADSRTLLSKLSPDMLEKMTYVTERYLEFAFTGSADNLTGVNTGGGAVFSVLFPEEKQITGKKLNRISGIFIYPIQSGDDDTPHYAVSVSADTSISYTDDSGRASGLNDTYKAVVEFSGTDLRDLEAVSGGFVLSKPNYPQPPSVPEEDIPTDGPQNDTPDDPAE